FLLQQDLHVRTDTGYAEQPRLFVHCMIQPFIIKALFSHQVKKHTGIKVAAAGSHHETSCRSQTHRGIEGLTIQHCSQTRTVTEMSDHQTALGPSTESEHDVLV